MMFHQITEIDQLLSYITLIALDRSTSTGTIVTTDGESISFPLPFEPDPNDIFRKLTYDGTSNQLILETNRGDAIFAEFSLFPNTAVPPNRPVVYLDQKDWSLLANVLYERDRVISRKELAAAKQLIDLAQDSKIILPMSLGHMGETAKWSDRERRYRLGLTVARLSRGWQMRHPLDIRASEIRRLFTSVIGHKSLLDTFAFTLDPCAAESTSTSTPYFATHSGLDPVISKMAEVWTCAAAYFEVLLLSESVPIGSAPGWVESNQDYTRWLASEAMSSDQKRNSVWRRLKADLAIEIAQVAYESNMSPEDMKVWLARPFHKEIKALPSLSIFCEIYQDKHLNTGTIWTENDLIDMTFLSCAAAYADFVVGERSLVSYARQAARRLDRQISIHSRMSDLLSALRASGI